MSDSKMIARVADKVNTQAMIKALRAAGLKVTGTAKKGYKSYHGFEADENLVFSAIPGRTGYLIRLRENLFT